MDNFEKINEVVNNIKAKVALYIPGYAAEEHPIIKNNLQMTGITIKPVEISGDIMISPMVYIDRFIDDSDDIDEIANAIINTIMNNQAEGQSFTELAKNTRDWSFIKDRLMMSVISIEGNEEYLRDKLYVVYQDMAIIFRVVLSEGSPDEPMASVAITKSQMNIWNKTKDEIMTAAMESPLMRDFKIMTMRDILIAKMGEDIIKMTMPELYYDTEKPSMYVITNDNKCNGAGLIAYSPALEALYQTIGEDYFVLPSSIHELIAVPMSQGDPNALKLMVCQVNASEVAPEERLTNSVYCYKTGVNGTRCLQIA